ncbi:RNA-binding Raly-like protein isoform X2 [Esox lucius]|uniref:RNA-binding Raly-like protein isoform X2 n=1 Tax=Esox lucius TaxID=8010 RepID=UPI000576ED49|nr:RNA-binding Raly-like protein isoform X2 [Esox lucius]
MTLFKSEYHSLRHKTMTGEMRASRPKAGTKRASSEAYRSDYDLEYDSYPDDLYNRCVAQFYLQSQICIMRVFDYQRVPASMMPAEPSPLKRSRGPSSGLHRSRDRAQGKRSTQHTGSTNTRVKLKMAELLAIKTELTLIKVQIDGLLDSVDKMDRQRKDQSDSPLTREGSVSDSVSSLDDSPTSLPQRQRESPEPGEASEDDHHHQNPHRMNYSDLEDDM